MVVNKNILFFLIGFITCALLFRSCDGSIKTITKYKTKIVKVTDTIYPSEKIVTKYKNVYIDKKDTTFVYVDKPTTSSLAAKLYKQPIKSSRGNGFANITTTGDLIDFSATIEYSDTIKETTITKFKNNSQLFLSLNADTKKNIDLGLDWNLRNKLILKGAIGLESNVTEPYIRVGIGIPIF